MQEVQQRKRHIDMFKVERNPRSIKRAYGKEPTEIMKKTPLKRKTPLRSKTGFKNTRTQLKRTPLRKKGRTETAVLKEQIQSLLREIVMIRDGGCFLRHYQDEITPQYRNCGCRRKDGQLILQAEHLQTRSNGASFADSRLVVCICKRHHIYYKPQHSDEYNSLAKRYIGKKNTELWDRVKEDHRPHKVDLKLEKLALEQELKKLQS